MTLNKVNKSGRDCKALVLKSILLVLITITVSALSVYITACKTAVEQEKESEAVKVPSLDLEVSSPCQL